MQHQPFFKIPNNSHYFSLEKFSSGQEPKPAPRQVTPNFFKQPAAKVQVEAERTKNEHLYQLEVSGADKMSGLYSRIHQEAEKLQKWKAVVVVELKQKDQQLEEASCNNDLLRKSLVDLQVENENLSSSLHSEKLAHQEIRQQVHTTRNMCGVLKDRVSIIEASIEEGEVVKEELKHNEQEIVETCQELADQFKLLHLQSTDEQQILRIQVDDQKKHSAYLADQHELAMTAANQKIHSLEDVVVHQKNEMEHFKMEADLKSGLSVELKDQLDTMANDLHGCKKENETMTEQLNTALEEALRNSKCLQDELNQVKHLFDQTKLQLKDAKEELFAKEQSTCQFEKVLSELNVTLEDAKESLKQCEIQSVEDKSTIADLQSNITALQEAVEKYKGELHSVENERVLLDEHLCKIEDKSKSVVENLNREMQQFLNEKGLLQMEIQTLRQDLKMCHTQNKECEQQLVLMKEIVECKEAECTDLAKKSTENIDSVCGQLLETLQYAATVSGCEIEDVDKRSPVALNASLIKCIISLCHQHKETCSANVTLGNQKSKMEETINELQRSLDDIRSKSKQQEQLLVDNEKAGLSNVKSLEKEIELQAKLVTTLTSKIEQLNHEIISKNEVITDIEAKETLIRAELLNSVELLHNADNEVITSKKQLHIYQEQQKEVKQKFDQQGSEMCATLEKYKAESQKAITQKDKEIEVLKEHQLSNLNFLEESHRLKAEITRLKVVIDNISQEKEIILNEHKSSLMLVKTLKKQLTEMKFNSQPKDSVKIAELLKDASSPQPPTSRGILRQVQSNKNGNKRVAFVSSGSDHSDVETGILEESIAQTDKQRNSPGHNDDINKLKSTPSPNVRIAPSFVSQQRSGIAVRKLPSRAKKVCITQDSDSEMTRFNELFPSCSISKKSKDTKVGLRRNTKHNDSKSTPTKSYKYSSLTATRKSLSKFDKQVISSKQPDMSWFEVDPVFGFSAED